MKVSCPQEQFSKGLSVVGRAVSTKTTLPVLNNILLSTETTEAGGRVKLSATNLEISITVWVNATIEEEGEVTVPARLLSDFVSSLGATDSVHLALDPSNLTLNVKSGRFEANIRGIAAEDFPSLPSVTNPTNVAYITANVLRETVAQVSIAASGDETRPALTGIFTKFEGDQITMASADGFRMAVRNSNLARPVENNFSALLPARAMQELARILPDDETEVEITTTANKSQALFKTEGVNFTSSLIEGNFPNYKEIIPKQYTTRTVINTGQLLRAVKVASYFAKDNGGNIVRLTINPGQDLTPGYITMTANAQEVGDNKSEIDATVDGGETQIAFNAKYLGDVLNVISTSEVAIELQSPSNPGVIKPVGKEDYVHVIMPMHLATRG
jgi:DNA polymerase III subunit beta